MPRIEKAVNFSKPQPTIFRQNIEQNDSESVLVAHARVYQQRCDDAQRVLNLLALRVHAHRKIL